MLKDLFFPRKTEVESAKEAFAARFSHSEITLFPGEMAFVDGWLAAVAGVDYDKIGINTYPTKHPSLEPVDEKFVNELVADMQKRGWLEAKAELNKRAMLYSKKNV
jgi:hypothetical protein